VIPRNTPVKSPCSSGLLTALAPVMERATVRLVERLARLEQRLDADEESVWRAYVETARALAMLLLVPSPSNHALLTTDEMAARMGISPKTLLKRRRQGLELPALQHGRLLRWRADQVGR
jgi:helix-turn-helix protein